MEKPVYIYKAIVEAIKAWEDRHYITGREHLAPLLGFRGTSASIQVSNMLNYKTYNPRAPKAMKLSQLVIILEELDGIDAMHILNAFAYPLGLQVTMKSHKVRVSVDFGTALDSAMLESSDVFRVGKVSMQDGVLSLEELKALEREIEEAEVANARLKSVVMQKIREKENDNE